MRNCDHVADARTVHNRPDGDGEEAERERERGEDAPGLQPFGYLPGLPNPLQMPGRRIADRDTAGR
jgi:hypothetical protein